MKNVEMTCWTSEKLRDDFKKRFPHCFSRFVRNAMFKALHDKQFFDDVFFGNDDTEED